MTTFDELQKALLLVPGGQADFVCDVASPFKALVAGMGAGKTYAAVASTLTIGSLNQGLPFLFVEPTYGLIEDVAIPAFEDVLERAKIPTKWHARQRRMLVGYGRSDGFEIWFRSGDNPGRIVGFEAAAACIDEPGLQRPEVFKRVVQRVRHPKAFVKQVALTGTPEDLNWFYEVCEAKPPKGMRLHRARTTDNPFQSSDYVANLRATLSEQEVEAYIDGRFVNMKSGRVYKSWSRMKHAKRIERIPVGANLVVGCDFNVDKMSWVIGYREGHSLVIIDELIGNNTNTYRQTEALIERLKEWVHAVDPYRSAESIIRSTQVYTDASGSQRKTSANESDLQILRAAGFSVQQALANPPIKDRVHSVEAKLRGAFPGSAILQSEPTLRVDITRCFELCRSLDGQAWGADGMPEKARGALDMSGPVDALGYLVWGFPEWRASLPRGNNMQVESYI